ncbi:MAG: hypothetical protein A3G20_04350 [Acidobacteria bacterium RIFCSPLOWO2_12_FULL_59_11]|nr:MAG: hypothetical protein A3G20_04350 [Acidobacteria bacterium RIFCSPLOWO2_12_FULL_59_11]
MQLSGKIQGVAFFLSLACAFLSSTAAYALPEFLLRFSQDPFSRPELRNQCSTCHLSPMGGGPRNPFGAAFEKSKHVVTPEFRQAWPSHFLPNVSSEAVPAGPGEVKATFLSSEREIILEISGEHFRLRPGEASLEKIAPEEAANLMASPPPPPPSEEPKLPLRKQPTFDHYLVNLPTTLPYKRGGISLRFTHRFTQPVLVTGKGCTGCADLGSLYGLDSFSFSSIGGNVGITDRLAATVYRSPLDKTIEMGGVFQLLRQEGREPLSASVRVTVEGRNNFRDFYTTNLVFPISGAISNVAELFVVPMVNFNANPFASAASPFAPEGKKRSHQGSVGLGTSIRFRPRSAFVAEWMPRVAGFHDQDSRNAVSFGILRSTNAHVFELVLTNTLGTTTSRSASHGEMNFALGFNLYRRLR